MAHNHVSYGFVDIVKSNNKIYVLFAKHAILVTYLNSFLEDWSKKTTVLPDVPQILKQKKKYFVGSQASSDFLSRKNNADVHRGQMEWYRVGKSRCTRSNIFPRSTLFIKNLTWNGLGLNAASVLRDIVRI